MKTKRILISIVLSLGVLAAVASCGEGMVSAGSTNTGTGGDDIPTGTGDTFGTVTDTNRTVGDMTGIGSSSSITHGGYMKFDLRDETGGSVGSAKLRFYVKSWSDNPWRWVTRLINDPATASPLVIFNEIKAHTNLVTNVITLSGNGWYEYNLSSSAVTAINSALAQSDPDKKWVAFALAFE